MKKVEVAHMNESQRAEAHNECDVLTHLAGHPFIIRVHEFFEEVTPPPH